MTVAILFSLNQTYLYEKNLLITLLIVRYKDTPRFR
ncbi:hypothetical protein BC643_1970 [Mangrovibacterium diazotrophicum]|uniref:Uncharacterized protein n=1 Tax=Mangrovibacterium diazotrophicum TaxID=1261403 RepID=A0A419W8C1_9BACT|nr:hypothetical protein BC643_1970 [Mangrovibacterium diazotrophicum]